MTIRGTVKTEKVLGQYNLLYTIRIDGKVKSLKTITVIRYVIRVLTL